MDVIKAPTDNLYKFIAISGVLIAVLSFVLPFTKVQELKHDLIVIEGELELVEMEVEFMDESTKEKQAEDVSLKERQEILRRFKVLENRSLLVSHLYANIERWVLVFGLGTGFGVFIACMGFWLWYVRLQRYQDMLLKTQAEKET